MAKYQITIVNCYHLNVRNGAGTGFKISSVVNKGDKFTSSKQKNGWYYLDSKKGWVSGSYVKVTKNLSSGASSSKNTAASKKTTTSTAKKSSTSKSSSSKKSTTSGGKSISDKFAAFTKDGQVPVMVGDDDVAIDPIKVKPLKTFGSTDFDKTVADYYLDYSFIKKNLETIRKNYNIKGENYRDIKQNLFNRFNRFKICFPDVHLSKTFSHVFFTRPDLNLLSENGKTLNAQVNKDPFFGYLFNNNPLLVKSLTSSFTKDHDFHPYLSNSASSFEVSDEVIETVEHGETFTGYKMQYGKHNIKSNTAGQFTVHYNDDNEFSIYKTHKAWTEYISRVFRGDCKPYDEYIRYKILDYAVAVYYFVCGPDGETILFWSKYFGVFPLNTPASNTSWSKGSSVKLPDFAINYAYSVKEDFNPLTLAEFNMNSTGKYIYRKIYEPTLLSTGKTLSGAPFIATSTDSNNRATYKLKFRT